MKGPKYWLVITRVRYIRGQMIRFFTRFFSRQLISKSSEHLISLDTLDKVAKRFDFHSTTSFSLDFFDRDQTSLDIIRRHSTC